jgi:cyclic-di-GMP phosphodiesterase, flagellum assembly factor TipF
MIRLSALFVAICMVAISGAFGAALYLAFALTGAEAVAVSLAALTGLAIYNTVAMRVHYQNDLMTQLTDLSRGTADLARQVAEQGRRIAEIEKEKDTALTKALAVTRPIQDEIGELGGLVSQLAETVAAQEIAWRTVSEEDRLAYAAPPRTPQPRAESKRIEPPGPIWKPILPAGQSAATVPPEEASTAVRMTVNEIEPPPLDTPKKLSEGPFRDLTRAEIISIVGEAVGHDRIELYLQPIVTLPQRKVRFYEALMRLRLPDERIVAAEDFMPYALASGLMPEIDRLMLTRCVRVVRRLKAKQREVGVFCNLSGMTLADADAFPRILDIADANRALASELVFELPYPALRSMGVRENENIASLTDLGYRLSVDHVADLRFDAGDLAARKCGYMKISSAVMLDRANQASAKIHLADMSGYLARYGIELIIEKIEEESTVVDLFDFDIKFAQGNLFSPPRPIRPESMADTREEAESETPATAAIAKPAVTPASPPVMRSTADRPLAQLARAAVRK